MKKTKLIKQLTFVIDNNLKALISFFHCINTRNFFLVLFCVLEKGV